MMDGPQFCASLPGISLGVGFPSGLIWETSKHPLLAVLLAALFSVLVVPRIAHKYQVRAKVMEFRFSIYRETVSVYAKLSAAGWLYLSTKATLHALKNSRPEHAEEVPHWTNEIGRWEAVVQGNQNALDKSVLEGRALQSVMVVLFGEETQQHWRKVVLNYERVMFEEDLRKNLADLKAGTSERTSFLRSAAAEIPLPFAARPTIPEQARETEEAQARLDRLLGGITTDSSRASRGDAKEMIP